MARSLVGTRIRERRRAQKLSQKKLAEAAGISASYMNLIEHNRRGIAGRTLLAIADTLEINASDLSAETESGLVNLLTETAQTETDTTAEISRVEEFIGRYPGWADLIGSLARTTRNQKESLTALTDRMNHDPFLAETMHQILSNITAIRSTAGILDTTPDISDEQRQRFVRNLRTDSQRLSSTAQSVVEFFDNDAPQESTSASAESPLQGFWTDHKFFVESLETNETDVEELVGKAELSNGKQISGLFQSLSRYQRIAKALPWEKFEKLAVAHNFDPLEIATRSNTPVADVILRLAHMPSTDDLPKFGLFECDMSGAVLLRKNISGFSLPQFSSACPLWPIYRAFGVTNQPVRAVLEMPTGERFVTFGIAQNLPTKRYDVPALQRSLMIFTSDSRAFPPTRSATSPILAGLHCSVCPRQACEGRRTDYILS